MCGLKRGTMRRIVRCQGIILRENHVLLLRQYNDKRNNEYWMLPGGGLEVRESEKRMH